MGKIDEAGRTIAGLLTYNPGPGIYSRLERAIEAMPENVRVQELPGLLKRYKDGVPGWELKATDLDSTIAGRDVVPKSELLAAVKERSPVYTHQEIVLGGTPPMGSPLFDVPQWQERASRLGGGVSHGYPRYQDYGQGGKEYSEVLLLQPGASGEEFGSHWGGHPQVQGTNRAVAHARFDTHGDALRINELQSDLGIHNRKIRESGGRATAPQQLASETDAEYRERLEAAGWMGEWSEDGELIIRGQPTLPFPLEDAWSDLLIKRLALEAARKGHRAIEIASPRAIADKVGGNIDNYEHFYGKVVPGALERLGRKMGGLTEDAAVAAPPRAAGYESILDDMRSGSPTEGQMALRDAIDAMRKIKAASPAGPRPAFDNAPSVAWNKLASAYLGDGGSVDEQAALLHAALAVDMSRAGGDGVVEAARMMPELVRLAENHAAAMQRYRSVQSLADAQRAALKDPARAAPPPGRRYIMSDEMRKRILTQGIGASLLAPVAAQEE